jgi:hypothetical protein
MGFLGKSQTDSQFKGKEGGTSMTKYLVEKEVSELIRRAVQTLRNDRHYGRGIPYVKNGKSVLYRLEDVENFMNVRRISTSDEE